jgi:hypothetical protein
MGLTLYNAINGPAATPVFILGDPYGEDIVHFRERDYPRISVTKLGEYAAANDAARRRRIIMDQKRPKDYIVPMYTEAQGAITDFLVAGTQDDESLFRKVDEFSNAAGGTSWRERKNQVCAEALLTFLAIKDQLDLSGYELLKGELEPPKLLMQGVSVSVRPEILLTGTTRIGNSLEGAVKLYFSKNHPMSKEAGLYAATTLHHYITEYPRVENSSCDHRMCYVVDVFGRRVFTAPRSYKQRRASIEASCEEIKRAWPEL